VQLSVYTILHTVSVYILVSMQNVWFIAHDPATTR